MGSSICVICKGVMTPLNTYEECSVCFHKRSSMKQVITKQPVLRREYGGNVYIGETETHYLVTIIDCEGVKHSVVHALSKENYKVKE